MITLTMNDNHSHRHIAIAQVMPDYSEGWVYAEQPHNFHQPQAEGSVSGRGGWVFKHVGALLTGRWAIFQRWATFK